MTTITIERATLDRLIDAWDSTVLPKSRDGMMQERMEDLRAALAAPATAPSQLQCVLAAWIPPEREGEFHHEHESITAFRTPMAGWVPVYRHLPATAPVQPSWQDAPTKPGLWACLYMGELSTAIFNAYEIEHFDASEMGGCRWQFIPEDNP